MGKKEKRGETDTLMGMPVVRKGRKVKTGGKGEKRERKRGKKDNYLP